MISDLRPAARAARPWANAGSPANAKRPSCRRHAFGVTAAPAASGHWDQSFPRYAVASISTRQSGEPNPVTMQETRCGGSSAKFAKYTSFMAAQ